jgi:hypothetical protein
MNAFLLTAWIACQSFDAGSTYVAIRSGHFHEANPAMSHRALYPLKLTVNLTALWAYHKVGKSHRATVAIPIAFAATGCVAGTLNTQKLMSR